MDPAQSFQIANSLALCGWLALLASPFLPRLAQAIAGIAIPLLLSIAYAGLVMAFWAEGEGGFDTLANVARLFETPQLLLAGWIHYLAFDMLIGAWEVRTARREGIAFLLVLPCLVLTFLFGPAGYLVFSAVRLARRLAADPALATSRHGAAS